MKLLWGILTSIVFGFFLMFPLAMLFDRMQWPVFDSGELAHITFLVAWPMLTLLSFGALYALNRILPKSKPPSR